MADEIQPAPSLCSHEPHPSSLASEKAEIGSTNETSVSTYEDQSLYTLVSQLWSWMAGTSTTSSSNASSSSSSSSSSNTQSHIIPLDLPDEKAQHTSGVQTTPTINAQEALELTIDEPREPGFKNKGSAPSRGTHRDYPATRDALWSGGGNRAVPEGLRRAAGGGSHGGGDEGKQQGAPSGGGADGDGDDDEDDDRREESNEGRGARQDEERVELKYKRTGNRRKPKHRPGV